MPDQPAEPIQPINNNTTSNTTTAGNTNPDHERLQKILDALSEYHKHLLIQYTHFTQTPDELLTIQTLLRQKEKIIRNFLLYNKVPPNVEPELIECLEHLKAANTPWDPEVSVLTNYWCDLMFIKHPFTMSHHHIQSLLKNSLVELENDSFDEIS